MHIFLFIYFIIPLFHSEHRLVLYFAWYISLYLVICIIWIWDQNEYHVGDAAGQVRPVTYSSLSPRPNTNDADAHGYPYARCSTDVIMHIFVFSQEKWSSRSVSSYPVWLRPLWKRVHMNRCLRPPRVTHSTAWPAENHRTETPDDRTVKPGRLVYEIRVFLSSKSCWLKQTKLKTQGSNI